MPASPQTGAPILMLSAAKELVNDRVTMGSQSWREVLSTIRTVCMVSLNVFMCLYWFTIAIVLPTKSALFLSRVSSSHPSSILLSMSTRPPSTLRLPLSWL